MLLFPRCAFAKLSRYMLQGTETDEESESLMKEQEAEVGRGSKRKHVQEGRKTKGEEDEMRTTGGQRDEENMGKGSAG
eukprot:2116437-Rhodomonas_salina.1